MVCMDAAEALASLGGVAARAEILALVTEGALRRAVTDGSVLRRARGRYALPAAPRIGERAELTELAEAGRRAAHELSGTAILLSAAARWGWRTKWVPTRPQVAVPRNRRVPSLAKRGIDVRMRDVASGDREDGWVTTRVRTALDCAGLLPADEAIAVLDSALREGAVERDELLLGAAGLPPRYRRKAEGRIRRASSLAANPFESVLRWIVSDIPGLKVDPQVHISDDEGLIGIVDLADRGLRLVLEADSFEWHGDRAALERDCIRYNRLIAEGWLVLRFSWDQVMHHPERVRALVIRTVQQSYLRVRRPLPDGYAT